MELALPVVACSVDGQAGPRIPSVPATADALLLPSIAGTLSLYSDGTFLLLAPRGWRCVESYGSSGVQIRVVPADSGLTDAQVRAGDITTPAVTMDYWNGGTSGRFEVAGVGAPLFQNLVILASTLNSQFPGTNARSSPWVGETLTVVSPTLARFQDPPGTLGTGTNETGLVPGALGVQGTVRERASGFSDVLSMTDLVVLAVRLGPDSEANVPIIESDFEERSKGP